ncbi:hypothetical protein [Cyanobium sp. FACHB-13342]|uniref:hypothetical protein n=1 Tax=Cyanobium sp. FACHB-13342 TaxID=2692793 RepID=UPI0016809B6A|nr:hypothetical protein [Cyanobium sp. FACHB-13342]MBD2423198.1 hypothetical protein [Cyanobium sp. FACHB-13342]
MGDRSGNATPTGNGSALSVLAGAVIGAAGLAWWLLSEAERRRLEADRPRRQRSIPLQDAVAAEPYTERDLHDRVHELNQAIDDVRRQLETMNPQP